MRQLKLFQVDLTMKILHIAYFGRNRQMNGVSESVINLAKAQVAQGQEVKLAMANDHDLIDGKFICLTDNVEVFSTLIDEFIPDIAVFHSLYERFQISYSHILRKRNVPYVLVFHGGASIDNAHKHAMKKRIANLLFFNRIIRYADRVVYLNTNEKEKSVFRRINNRDAIIPNGVMLRDNIFQRRGNDKINISFISRMDYWGKGLDLLYEAIEQLKNSPLGKILHFSFYGYATDQTYKVFNELGNISHYYGYVSGQEKQDAFLTSDVLILPSRSEGMPMTILEALAYGIPCIVTPETNMADLIADNGCGWVTELTIESIVKTIKKCCADIQIDYEGYYKRCKQVAALYSWENIARTSTLLYTEILNERNG